VRELSCARLLALRRRVDAVDRRIVRLLGSRQRLVAALKPFKTRLRDPGRAAKILRDKRERLH
jgi:chorismate mutase